MGVRATLPSSATWPNFFLAGVPKAGTTSLFHYLDQHPEVFMSPMKEPHYFAEEIRPENLSSEMGGAGSGMRAAVQAYLADPNPRKTVNGIIENEADYLQLFRGASHEAAIGEASVTYLWSPTAPARIAARLPDARIVVVLRNPVERAFAQYRNTLLLLPEPLTFADLIDAGMRDRGPLFSHTYPLLGFGLYRTQLLRYLNLFPRDRILVLLHDDYRSRPAEVLRAIFTFLGVNPGFEPDRSIEHLPARVARSRFLHRVAVRKLDLGRRLKSVLPSALHQGLKGLLYRPQGSVTMDPADRARLVSFYRDEVEGLADLLRRDLSHWLAVSGGNAPDPLPRGGRG